MLKSLYLNFARTIFCWAFWEIQDDTRRYKTIQDDAGWYKVQGALDARRVYAVLQLASTTRCPTASWNGHRNTLAEQASQKFVCSTHCLAPCRSKQIAKTFESIHHHALGKSAQFEVELLTKCDSEIFGTFRFSLDFFVRLIPPQENEGCTHGGRFTCSATLPSHGSSHTAFATVLVGVCA